MIKVEARQINNQWQAFSLSGHAGSGPYGYDIVCAAVSAVTLSVINNAERLLGISLQVDADREQGGYLSFECPEGLSMDQAKQLQFLCSHFYWALKDIESQYPKFIQIDTNE